jgi:putative pyruvate formate lyase activating enzyme
MERYRRCMLCPRECGVDRLSGRRGVCGMGATPRVAAALPHFGEEPPVSGTRGSGAVFFVGCGLGCVICQNHQISHELDAGRAVTVEGLTRIFEVLAAAGAHNLNLVTATQAIPHVEPAIRAARERGIDLPVVWNSSGYERPEVVDQLAGLVDVYLVDAKFDHAGLAQQVARAPDYPRCNREAIARMVEQVGHLQLDEAGLARRGVIVRHLSLPGHLDDTYGVLSWLAERFGAELTLSLMTQYRPVGAALPGELGRSLREDEAEILQAWVDRFGFTRGWTQELSSRDCCVPDFEAAQPFDFERP